MNSNNRGVKQLRLQRAWSQEQLAEMAGSQRPHDPASIENGERPLETLSALRRGL